MPRTARIDIPGILHHVIVRGIERRVVFMDNSDRESFTARLARLLEQTGTDCLAWALMDNHFHLLLRTGPTKLATFMRRLLTGHAVTFNLRHGRVGHLFQNRYKSIVCEEEPYLLALVRYIHLNPLRAGAVGDMEELDRYPWSGHAVLMGNRELAGQQTEEILSRFGCKKAKARHAYRQFVADGIALGKRSELTGGGLRRSGSVAGKPESFDERILGGGEFIERIRGELSEPRPVGSLLPLDELINRIAVMCNVDSDALLRRTRVAGVAEARSIVCFVSVREMGYSGAEVARTLKMSRAGVTLAVARGAGLLASDSAIRDNIASKLAG
ncbi:transposase [Geobacter pickeringii]|uniref:Transposase n=1 Tax=Geobacter pickeringii TaxID=345632 RepID=A0A0B5BE17_9BACT|nr:transposase [Geobacter pickeringii]AJE02316.1 transposase [Geobacter pickeringii]